VASLLGSNSGCALPLGMAEHPLHPSPTLSNPHECAFIRMNPHSSASTHYHYSHRHSMTEVSRPAHGALFLLVRLKAIQLLLATILAITTTTTNSDEKIPMPTA
jgi:hypothetical protein